MAGVTRAQRTLRLAGLWYLLASTYVLARLITNRLVLGVWGLEAELLVEAVVIPLSQLGAVLLFRLDRRARPEREVRAGGDPGMDGA
jgi:hypothetical protein